LEDLFFSGYQKKVEQGRAEQRVAQESFNLVIYSSHRPGVKRSMNLCYALTVCSPLSVKLLFGDVTFGLLSHSSWSLMPEVNRREDQKLEGQDAWCPNIY